MKKLKKVKKLSLADKIVMIAQGFFVLLVGSCILMAFLLAFKMLFECLFLL